MESFHRRLKEALRAQSHPSLWTDSSPLVLLDIRNAIKEDLAELQRGLNGQALRLPGDFHMIPTEEAIQHYMLETLRSTVSKMGRHPLEPGRFENPMFPLYSQMLIMFGFDETLSGPCFSASTTAHSK